MSDFHNISLDLDVADGLPQNQYMQENLTALFDKVLQFIEQKLINDLVLPYYVFDDVFTFTDWQKLSKSISIYVCNTDEGLELNKESRGKDYATNILSYPSQLPKELLVQMGDVFLGELVICHDVVVKQGIEQDKTFDNHLTHLVIHGILHLLGFDHELGKTQQDEMESFEIAILQSLGIDNPYL